jgi:hypothetical protein
VHANRFEFLEKVSSFTNRPEIQTVKATFKNEGNPVLGLSTAGMNNSVSLPMVKFMASSKGITIEWIKIGDVLPILDLF